MYKKTLLILSLSIVLISPLWGDVDHWYRVDGNITLRDGLATKVIHYPGYRWIAVSDSGKSEMDGLNLQEVSFRLTLGEQTFDPAIRVPALPEAWRSTNEAGMHLIQWVGPTQSQWITELEAENLNVIQYIPPFTYVVWGKPTDRVRQKETIRWTGPFEPAYKVLPAYRHLDATLTPMSGLIYRNGHTADTLRQLQALGATDVRAASIDHRFVQVKFTAPGNSLVAAAAIDNVYTLRPQPQDGGLRSEYSNQINVGNYDGNGVPFTGYLTWLSSVNLDGTGVIMANVDGGVDQNHPDLAGRMISCTGSTCGGGAVDSHGTHTAGIMGADGAGGVTSGGFLRGLGVAPGSQMVEQLYSPTFTQPGGMRTLMEQSWENNAVLSGNSWGPSGSPQGYDDDTMQVDLSVRDADDDETGNQNFTYVLSFMNGNGGTSSQGTPDEAKNLFNIGSTKGRSSGGSAQDIFDLSSNTAHGPALDGRTIPHMVAPGCYVDSTVLSNGHGYKCGTSMASPHVAGATALFFEFYRGQFAADPSPALVKAAFMPVAIDLEGQDDADGGTLGHRPDSKQGWGRMDLEAVVNPAVAVTYHDNPIIFDTSGENWSANLAIPSAIEPVKLMLVWTDAAGHGLGGSTPAWNNDLDLLVDAGGQTYRGNDFGAAGWSNAGGTTADDKNNTEGVLLPAGTATSITIRVEATNINSDGIPGVGDSTDQDFSVVCYGCASSIPTPIFADGFESGDTTQWSTTQNVL